MSACCARWNRVAVAGSDDTVVVRGHRYFPVGSVVRDNADPTSATTHVKGCIGFWRGVEIVEVSAAVGTHDIAGAHLF